ncbi:hypothetical protein JTB14_037946 [Gonioctena quinquepunctata]|nr:hypothetical protein JTB14_037946 [Gonioctena quinquepunctata]
METSSSPQERGPPENEAAWLKSGRDEEANDSSEALNLIRKNTFRLSGAARKGVRIPNNTISTYRGGQIQIVRIDKNGANLLQRT